jgi:signal peptidase I
MGIKLVSLMVVVSNSMIPEFQRGDIIFTQSINTTPEIGDIITFNAINVNTPISHRVIGLNNGLILTKGDNNPTPDSYRTTQKDVIAKAIQINKHPIAIKDLGSLFITDYSKEGVIYKFGDRFTFLQQLSATVRAWGILITVVAILAYLVSMKGGK